MLRTIQVSLDSSVRVFDTFTICDLGDVTPRSCTIQGSSSNSILLRTVWKWVTICSGRSSIALVAMEHFANYSAEVIVV